MWKDSYSTDEVEVVDCPLCKSQASSEIKREWCLGIVRCSVCGLVYVKPRAKGPEKNYWGEREHALKKYGLIFNGSQSHNRDRNYQEHLEVIRAIKPTGRLLDIGTHCGFFLRMARNQGWELFGIEPSSTNAALAIEKFGLNVHTGYLQDGLFPEEYFDIVTMVDVLEHITEPLHVLPIIRRVLKPDGVLFIKVPNLRWNLLKNHLLSKLLKQTAFDIFDSREHVIHYSQDTLRKMLDRTGFMVVKFYVPLPIQTGEWWKIVTRYGAYVLSNITFFFTARLSSFTTDIACVAQRKN